MTKQRKKSSAVIALAIIVLCLTGCYSPSDFDANSPSPAQSTSSPADGYQVGEALPEDIAVELRRDITSGYGAYPLSNGVYLLTSRNEPLPEAVRQDIITNVAAIIGAPQDMAEYASTGDALGDFIAEAKLGTGKDLLILTPFCHPLDPQLQPGECYWRTEAFPDEPFSDPASAEAATEQWLTGQPDADTREAIAIPAP